MRLPLHRDEPEVAVLIISGACCIPAMAPFDEKARQVIDQAIAESGVAAEVKVMPATHAYYGGVPRKIWAQLLVAFQWGHTPAVLLNGKPVFYGLPNIEAVKAALLAAIERTEGEADQREC
jgi:hypothetical protein